MTSLLVGFIIAASIGLTGVGGGTIAAPLLIFVLGLPVAEAVGTALAFSAIVKLLVAPMYVFRKQVSFPILGWMLLGGLPGVLVGGRALVALTHSVDQRVLYIILGLTILTAAGLNVYRLVRPPPPHAERDHPRLLAGLMVPVGLEMGFSSAGSGALGSLALLGLTKLDGATVVGTGICFGLVLSIVGSGVQMLAHNFRLDVLRDLMVGGLVGALLGSLLAHWIPSKPLKWGMAIWLAGLGVQLFMRGIKT